MTNCKYYKGIEDSLTVAIRGHESYCLHHEHREPGFMWPCDGPCGDYEKETEETYIPLTLRTCYDETNCYLCPAISCKACMDAGLDLSRFAIDGHSITTI